MAASLLGYWPGETATASTPVSTREENTIDGGQRTTHEPAEALETAAVRPRSPVSETSSSHDVYYDALSAPATVAQGPVCVPSSSDITASEAGRSSLNDTPDMAWQTLQPPKELFDVPYGTPLEIESIMIASVEILHQQLVEERSFNENAAKVRTESLVAPQEVPVLVLPAQTEDSGVLMECSSRPYSSTVVADPKFSLSESPRNCDASIATTASGDSGYDSGLADPTLPRGRLSSLFNFGASFKISKDKSNNSKQPSLGSGSPTPSTQECVSCFEDFQAMDLVPLTCHSYCKPCFQTLISTALSSENHWPPKCCLNEIPTETLLPHLSPKERNRYKSVLQERSVPVGERIYCSKASCAAWIPPPSIEKAISCAVCTSCRQKTCTSCRGVYHATGECPRDPNLQATLQAANDAGWRRCYSCNAFVEHNQGCVHMTCRCKAQFCYVCGSQWRTCACSDVDLRRVLQAASTRRLVAETAAREAENRRQADAAAVAAVEAEAAEMREIVRQIEEFEVREAERLAQEEEEFRLAAIASRERHEVERVLAISKKYSDLRNDFDHLHAIQKVGLVERYEEERRELRQEDKMRRAMVASHAVELQLAQAVADAKISDSGFRFDQDYHSRQSKEREIEDKYFAELKAYWENRPGGQEKIVEGQNALRKAHEESYNRWDVARRAKHQQILDAAKENLIQIKSKHEVERAVAAGKIDGWEAEMRANRNADAKWVEKVVRVRVQMLEAMEMEEYAMEF